MSKNTFKTLDGREWEFSPVSLDFQSKSRAGLRQKMIDDGATFDIPQYEVELAGGGTQSFDFDDAYVQQKNDPDITARWQKYKDDTALFNARWAALYLEMLISNGLMPKVRECEAYQSDDWVKQHERYYIAVPEDEDARLHHFIRLEIFKTTEDTLRFIEAITVLSGEGRVKEEDIERLMSLFRGSLQKKPEKQTEAAE